MVNKIVLKMLTGSDAKARTGVVKVAGHLSAAVNLQDE